MNNMNIDLSEPYKFCALLNIKCLKNEIEDRLKGYHLSNVLKKNEEFICTFYDDKENKCDLILKSSAIRLLKYCENILERVTINEYLLFEHQILENRPNGVIYTSIQKDFTNSNRFKNRYVLIDILESRYVLTSDVIREILENLKLNKEFSMQTLFKLRRLECENSLQNYSNFITNFSTNLNYYLLTNVQKKDLYSARTYLNGEEVSNLYDSIEGEDKLYRIYDLYHGIVNRRNEYDLHSIHLGNLKQDAFDLKTLKGITEREENLIGKSLERPSNEYTKYLKRFLKDRYGYTTKFELDRELILKGLSYQQFESDKKKDISLYNENSEIIIPSSKKYLKTIFRKLKK